MILPTKHLPTERALLGVGRDILKALTTPKTVSALWDEIRDLDKQGRQAAAIDYKWFVLAVDMLFMLEALDLTHGVLQRRVA